MSRKPDLILPLDFFRGFEAAARHLSFTKAAEELYVTQSAISRQIRALEERLGVQLFVRGSRNLALTEAGQQMYRAADTALRTLREAADRIAPGAMQKMVTVTSSMAFCSLWLIPRLSAFRKVRPGVDVRVSANSQILDLDRDRIDLAIRYCPVQAAPSSAIRMFGEEIVPVCSPLLLKDPGRPLKSPADLRHHTLLHSMTPMLPSPGSLGTSGSNPQVCGVSGRQDPCASATTIKLSVRRWTPRGWHWDDGHSSRTSSPTDRWSRHFPTNPSRTARISSFALRPPACGKT